MTTPKPNRGHFKPGNKVGAAGRPTGSRSKASLVAEKMYRDQWESIVEKTIELANEGDMAAIKLVNDHIDPPRKGARIKIDGIPSIVTLDDVKTAITVINAKMLAGDISPEEAASVSAVVDLQRRAIETIDLEKRIAAIEAKEQS